MIMKYRSFLRTLPTVLGLLVVGLIVTSCDRFSLDDKRKQIVGQFTVVVKNTADPGRALVEPATFDAPFNDPDTNVVQTEGGFPATNCDALDEEPGISGEEPCQFILGTGAYAVHSRQVRPFRGNGAEPTAPVVALAEDGDPSQWMQDFQEGAGFSQVGTIEPEGGGEYILPGDSAVFEFEYLPGQRFSFVIPLAQANDKFFGLRAGQGAPTGAPPQFGLKMIGDNEERVNGDLIESDVVFFYDAGSEGNEPVGTGAHQLLRPDGPGDDPPGEFDQGGPGIRAIGGSGSSSDEGTQHFDTAGIYNLVEKTDVLEIRVTSEKGPRNEAPVE